jgi:hypothetical protein
MRFRSHRGTPWCCRAVTSRTSSRWTPTNARRSSRSLAEGWEDSYGIDSDEAYAEFAVTWGKVRFDSQRYPLVQALERADRTMIKTRRSREVLLPRTSAASRHGSTMGASPLAAAAA